MTDGSLVHQRRGRTQRSDLRGFDPLANIVGSWRVVVIAMVAGALVLGVSAEVRPAEWSSSSTVLFNPLDPTQALTGAGVAAEPSRLLDSQDDVVYGDVIVQKAAQSTGLTVQAIRQSVVVTTSESDSVVRIEARSSSKNQAAALANAVTTAYISQSREDGVNAINALADSLQPQIDDLTGRAATLNDGSTTQTSVASQVLATQLTDILQKQLQLRAAAGVYPGQVTLLTSPMVESSPTSLDNPVAMGVGGALGLLLGILLAFSMAWRKNSAPKHDVRRGAQS